MSITSNYKKLLNNFFLIVPIMDEKVNVSLLAYNVNILYEGVEIIFIYENENDNSIPEIENLKKSFKIQSHKTDKSGISGSIKTGLKYVNESGIVGIGLADDLGIVYQLDEIYKSLTKYNPSDKIVLTTTRYSKGGKRLHGSKIEHFISVIANFFLKFIYGTTDCTTACRFSFKKNFFDLSKNIEEETWAFNLLFISNAKKNNYEIIEVPLISIDRIKFGNSTFNLLSWIMKYLKTLTKSIKNLYFTKK